MGKRFIDCEGTPSESCINLLKREIERCSCSSDSSLLNTSEFYNGSMLYHPKLTVPLEFLGVEAQGITFGDMEMDFVHIKPGEVCVVDAKLSSAGHVSHLVQLSMYATLLKFYLGSLPTLYVSLLLFTLLKELLLHWISSTSYQWFHCIKFLILRTQRTL